MGNSPISDSYEKGKAALSANQLDTARLHFARATFAVGVRLADPPSNLLSLGSQNEFSLVVSSNEDPLNALRAVLQTEYQSHSLRITANDVASYASAIALHVDVARLLARAGEGVDAERYFLTALLGAGKVLSQYDTTTPLPRVAEIRLSKFHALIGLSALLLGRCCGHSEQARELLIRSELFLGAAKAALLKMGAGATDPRWIIVLRLESELNLENGNMSQHVLSLQRALGIAIGSRGEVSSEETADIREALLGAKDRLISVSKDNI